MFEAVLQAIKDADRIIIHRHTRPDGDAMGSQIGLKRLIEDNFPEKKVFAVGDGAGYLSFMESSAMDEIDDGVYEGSLAIILDCGSAGMICDDRYTKAKTTVRIDHHLFCGRIADIEVIDSDYESCCGLIAAFAEESGLRLSPSSAKALYTGMVTDSGRFKYDGTTARTFRLASLLMEQEFDTNELFRNLYADDFESKLLKAQFVLKIRFTKNRVAYIYTSREEADALGKDIFTLSRGMVNTMSDIKGSDIWVNFTEESGGVLCELRSSLYNINPIAVKYGGGGHAKASGAKVADYDTAMAMLADLDKMAGEEE